MNYVLAVLLIIIAMLSFGQMLFKVTAVTPAEDKYAQYSLCADDLITSVEGTGIYLTSDLMSALKGKREGDTVEMKIIRGGEKKTVEIMLRASVCRLWADP